MSAADPKYIRTALPYVIIDGRKCIGCGYELNGLKTNAKCPECGRPISTRRPPRFSDQMVYAPVGWLQLFALGCFLLAVASIVMAVILFVFRFLDPSAAAVASLVNAVVWYVGVLLVSRPRPVTPSTVIDPRVEWFAIRLLSRLTQVFWIVSTAMGLSVSLGLASGVSTPLSLNVLATVAHAVALLGLIPLCMLLSELTFWASDSSLGYGFRGLAWLVGFDAVVLTLANINQSLHILDLGGLLGVALFVPVFILFVAPPVYLVYCMWQLQSIARWAIRNNVTAQAKIDRLKERVTAPDPGAHPPRTAARPPVPPVGRRAR